MKRVVKNYFVPHEGNEHKPHFFREKSVFVMSLLIAFLFVMSLFQYALLTHTNLANIVSTVLVDLANGDRGDNSLNSLTINPLLTRAAQMKADDMAEKGYFAHNSPDGVTPWHWFEEAGYDFYFAGENLAVNFSDSERVEKAWMDSPAHRENILNSKYTEIGIATAKGEYKGKETTFVVQMFGRPAIHELPVNTTPESVAVVEEPEEEPTVAAAVKEEVPVETESPEIQEVAVRGESVNYASISKKLAASPQSSLFYIYVSFGAFVLLGLSLLVFVKIKVQHPRHILYGVFLVLFMIALTYINQMVIFSDIIVK
jgi:hypothetical protein